MKDNLIAILCVVAITAVIISAPTIWVLHSAMEARAFTRITGKPVSTWDAMWIELRVQEPAK